MTEQLFLLPPDITVLRPVEVEGSHGRHGMWQPRDWRCACGKTLQHNGVIPHLRRFHFYTASEARFVFLQAKLGRSQHLPTLVNLLGGQ